MADRVLVVQIPTIRFEYELSIPEGPMVELHQLPQVFQQERKVTLVVFPEL